jgi:hypothetical protein
MLSHIGSTWKLANERILRRTLVVALGIHLVHHLYKRKTEAKSASVIWCGLRYGNPDWAACLSKRVHGGQRNGPLIKGWLSSKESTAEHLTGTVRARIG